LALPFKSNNPGRSNHRINLIKRIDEVTCVAVTNCSLLEESIELKELRVVGLVGKILDILGSLLELSLPKYEQSIWRCMIQ
jgi:hypothetical protein